MKKLIWELEPVLSHLQAHPSKSLPGHRLMKAAAVAIVMREDADLGVELLMIQRARLEGDPWSGHMAFPGGRVDPQDPSPLGAAKRECIEEIGLNLDQHATHQGSLSQRPAIAGGKILPMAIHPFFFSLESEPVYECNDEVDEIVWVPLSLFLDPNKRETMQYRKAGIDWSLPCYFHKHHKIWGLSLQMIDEIRERLGF